MLSVKHLNELAILNEYEVRIFWKNHFPIETKKCSLTSTKWLCAIFLYLQGCILYIHIKSLTLSRCLPDSVMDVGDLSAPHWYCFTYKYLMQGLLLLLPCQA